MIDSVTPTTKDARYFMNWIALTASTMMLKAGDTVKRLEYDDSTNQITVYSNNGTVHRMFIQQIN